jgi:prepilin-type N-terminal cleavage/methylation domain-containing protein
LPNLLLNKSAKTTSVSNGSKFSKPARGFTLIETLIALVVAATAATVILAQVRGFYMRAERQRAAEFAATRVLNDVARLAPDSWPPVAEKGREPAAETGWRAGGAEVRTPALWPLLLPADVSSTVQVNNFSLALTAAQLPPVEVAYTPFQRLEVDSDGLSASLLMPALPTATTQRSTRPANNRPGERPAPLTPLTPGK